MRVSLRDATTADIAFIMRTERLPGHPERVGTFPREEHLRRMALPRSRYVICEIDGAEAGFAVLRRDEDGMGNLQLHRIAVVRPGFGHGAAFLGGLIREIFGDRETQRLWLDVLPDNAVARRLHASLGLRQEGVMRGALRLPDGARRDLLLMAMLCDDRPDMHEPHMHEPHMHESEMHESEMRGEAEIARQATGSS